MQNVLRAPRKGRVKGVKAKPGDTLAVDQVIVEFELRRRSEGGTGGRS